MLKEKVGRKRSCKKETVLMAKVGKRSCEEERVSKGKVGRKRSCKKERGLVEKVGKKRSC